MDNKLLLQKIVDKATEEILGRIREDVREEVSDLVESMAKATMEVIDACQCDDKCPKKDSKMKHQKGADKDAETPIGLEIHMHGVNLDENDRLRFSKMVCEFLDSLDDDGEEGDPQDPAVAEGEAEEGDDGDSVCVEKVTIQIDKGGKAKIDREVVEEDPKKK